MQACRAVPGAENGILTNEPSNRFYASDTEPSLTTNVPGPHPTNPSVVRSPPSLLLSLLSSLSLFIMTTLSPPPMRHRASSTNLRPALTLATLGPRPKVCSLLDSIPGTPPATGDIRKMGPSLASPSRLSALIERCWDLLHVYSHLPSYSTPSSPCSPSEDSVLPMSSTSTTFGDDVEEKLTTSPKLSPSRSWFQSMPSVCS